MNREIHVRFSEGVGVKFPCATQRRTVNELVRRGDNTKPCGAAWRPLEAKL